MRDRGRHLGSLARWRGFVAARAVLDFHALTWPESSVRGGRLGCLGRRPRRLTVEPHHCPRRTGRIWRTATPAPRQGDHGGGQYRDDPPHPSVNAVAGRRLRPGADTSDRPPAPGLVRDPTWQEPSPSVSVGPQVACESIRTAAPRAGRLITVTTRLRPCTNLPSPHLKITAQDEGLRPLVYPRCAPAFGGGCDLNQANAWPAVSPVTRSECASTSFGVRGANGSPLNPKESGKLCDRMSAGW